MNTPIEETVEQVPLKAIAVASNVRSDMDAKKLDELEAMVKASGMAQPVELRPQKVAGQPVEGKYFVTFGHRRVLVAERLGWPTVPAIIRDRPDDEVELLQIQENDGREDLHALDRAAGYKKLQDRGMDAAAIAKTVGRARSTVELTLKLADLVDAGRRALRDGWLPQGAAEELALVPPSLQPKALKDLEQLEQDGELTRDTARTVLRAKYFLDLGEVLFDIRDATLVPSAGACVPSCTKRTGAQVELFGKKDGPDCCMDMPCLRAKEGAWLKLREKEGRRVLSGAEVKKVFEFSDDRPDQSSGLVLADDKDYRTSASKTYRAELGKEAAQKIVLARSPTGALVELVDMKDLPKPSAAAKASPAVKHEKSSAEKKREEAAKVKRLVAARCVLAFADANGSHLKPPQVYRAAVAGLIKELQHESRRQLCKVLELNADDNEGCRRALEKHAKALDPDGLGAFVVQLAGASSLTVGPYEEGRDEHLLALCKLTDHSLVGIQKDIELELRDAKKEKAVAKVAAKSNNDRCCAIVGCKRVALCKGFCKAHYQKSRSLERTGRKPNDWKDFAPPNSVRDVILPRLSTGGGA